MSRIRRFSAFTVVAVTVLVGLAMWADGENRCWRDEELLRLQHLVSRLGLTDLALWTEARYARHPSQTDLFSAFQDFPGSPEHFPAGSIIPPPPALRAGSPHHKGPASSPAKSARATETEGSS